MTAVAEHAYGWKPSLPDLRNQVADVYGLTLRDEVDPRDEMPDPYDQGNLGSCTGNAVAGAIEYNDILNGDHIGTPSRLFIYYGERELEGSIDWDAGAYGHDGFRVARKIGTPTEFEWAYDISRFRERPVDSAYEVASTHKIGLYKHPGLGQHSDQIRMLSLKAVLSNRQTIAFGFTVYESFESLEVERTGVVPMPGPGESVLGGHEVLLVGYIQREGKEYALVRNSWGTEWGMRGYCLMPWEFILNRSICDDFRTIYRPAGA